MKTFLNIFYILVALSISIEIETISCMMKNQNFEYQENDFDFVDESEILLDDVPIQSSTTLFIITKTINLNVGINFYKNVKSSILSPIQDIINTPPEE